MKENEVTMAKAPYSVLIATKKQVDDDAITRALRHCEANFKSVQIARGDWGDPLPPEIQGFEGDILISYMSRWIIPDYVLNNVKIAALNFHPAPPTYPGIGCTNFALYENATEFGATCHHMNPMVDTGEIVRVDKFPIYESDTVESLTARCYDTMLVQFYCVVDLLIAGKPLPKSNENWTRKPFTRKDLDKLTLITPDMSPEEIDKRIRATTFQMWKPEIKIGEYRFKLV